MFSRLLASRLSARVAARVSSRTGHVAAAAIATTSSSSPLASQCCERSFRQCTTSSRQQYHRSPIRHFSTSPPVFLDKVEVTDRIVAVVKNFDQVDGSKVTPETKFADDLGLDSLDVVEVVMAIEDEFAIEIPDPEADKIVSIADAVEYISTHPMAK